MTPQLQSKKKEKKEKKKKKQKPKTIQIPSTTTVNFGRKKDFNDWFIPVPKLEKQIFFPKKPNGKLKPKHKKIFNTKFVCGFKFITQKTQRVIIPSKKCGYRFIIMGGNLYFSLEEKYKLPNEIGIGDVLVMKSKKIDESIFYVPRNSTKVISKKSNRYALKTRNKTPVYGFPIKEYCEIISRCTCFAEERVCSFKTQKQVLKERKLDDFDRIEELEEFEEFEEFE
jgi:hypothetical protein